jgi:hypothetical protein
MSASRGAAGQQRGRNLLSEGSASVAQRTEHWAPCKRFSRSNLPNVQLACGGAHHSFLRDGHAGCFTETVSNRRPPAFRAAPVPLRQRGTVAERRQSEIRDARLKSTKAEIAARLQRVCPSMPPEEFDAMVEHMAVIEIKYSIRRGVDMFSQRTDE